MRASLFATVPVPALGASNPPVLAQAGRVPLRVLCRNVGGNLLLIAYEPEALQNSVGTAATFQIPVGDHDEVFLAPGQRIYAVGQGAGGVIAIATSEWVLAVIAASEVGSE